MESDKIIKAFEEWLLEKLSDIITTKEQMNISVEVNIDNRDGKLIFIGKSIGVSYDIFEEVLSYGTDFDLSGNFYLGLEFVVSFPEDFFGDYIEEEPEETEIDKDDSKDSDEDEPEEDAKKEVKEALLSLKVIRFELKK